MALPGPDRVHEKLAPARRAAATLPGRESMPGSQDELRPNVERGMPNQQAVGLPDY